MTKRQLRHKPGDPEPITSRPLGRRRKNLERLSGYIHPVPEHPDIWRVRYRIPKYLPGHTGKDMNIGKYESEELAVLSLDIFLAMYCLEYPETVTDVKRMIVSCTPDSMQEIIDMFPLIATSDDIVTWFNRKL